MPESFQRTAITSQVLVEATGILRLVPEVTGLRVVVTSLMLSAANSVFVEFWSGVTGSLEESRLTGQMLMTAGVQLSQCSAPGDCIFRLAAGKAFSVKPLAAVVVAGTISYYYEAGR